MVDAVVDLSWRAYPAALIALLGAVMFARGLRMTWGWAAHNDSQHNLRFIRGFRIAVIGLALAAIAVAWVWQLLWVFILALAIGGEETLESSVHAYAVRRGLRLEEEARAAEVDTAS
jgi:uncharacterized membrane protein